MATGRVKVRGSIALGLPDRRSPFHGARLLRRPFCRGCSTCDDMTAWHENEHVMATDGSGCYHILSPVKAATTPFLTAHVLVSETFEQLHRFDHDPMQLCTLHSKYSAGSKAGSLDGLKHI